MQTAPPSPSPSPLSWVTARNHQTGICKQLTVWKLTWSEVLEDDEERTSLGQIVMFYFCLFFCHAGTSAKLSLKKIPTEEKTFTLNINIKDNAGMGVSHAFEGEFILKISQVTSANQHNIRTENSSQSIQTTDMNMDNVSSQWEKWSPNIWDTITVILWWWWWWCH